MEIRYFIISMATYVDIFGAKSPRKSCFKQTQFTNLIKQLIKARSINRLHGML